jgi:hypothetical protein
MTMQPDTPEDKAQARRHAQIAAAIKALLIEAGRPGAGWPMMTSWPVTSRCKSRRDEMDFTDDLADLSRAEQIARVQAAAREHGDELDESQAAQALSLYATLTGTDGRWSPYARPQADADPQAGA